MHCPCRLTLRCNCNLAVLPFPPVHPEPDQLRAYWHELPDPSEGQVNEWLMQGRNLTAAVAMERVLAFCRQRRKREQAAAIGLPRVAPSDGGTEDGFYFCEGMAGTAPFCRAFLLALARQLADAGEASGARPRTFVQAIDWTERRYLGKQPMNEAQRAELGEGNYTVEDLLSIDLERLEDVMRLSPVRVMGPNRTKVKVLDQLHIAFPCETFSNMAQSTNLRHLDNHFMGCTPECYEANVRLLHALALCLLLRHRNPQMVLTFENPEANLQFHPLMRLAERPEQLGGLSLGQIKVNYCGLEVYGGPPLPRKDTHFWVPRDWVGLFLENGSPRYGCLCRKNHEVQTRGNADEAQRQICAYPRILVDLIVNYSLVTACRRRKLGEPRELSEALAPEKDDESSFNILGNFEYCVDCERPHSEELGNLVCCDFCPRVHHHGCMVHAARVRMDAADDGEQFRCEVCESVKGVIAWGD